MRPVTRAINSVIETAVRRANGGQDAGTTRGAVLGVGAPAAAAGTPGALTGTMRFMIGRSAIEGPDSIG